jgi:hypothetical protein
MSIMDRKNLIMLLGIGLILGFLGLYYIFKAPIYLFYTTMGVLTLVYGFYTEGNEIKVSLGYGAASFSVNIIQWLIVYSFYYSPVHHSIQFNMALGVAILTTLFLINRLHKEYIKTHENTKETLSLLKDPKKLMLIFTGIIIIISCLTGFIAYHAFTFLYVATLGLTAFVYGYYHENGKINISAKYIEIMAATILLQWIVFICFYNQLYNEIATQDLALLFTISALIIAWFIVQFIKSDITLADLILD